MSAGHVELKLVLGKQRARTKSAGVRVALYQTEQALDAARAAQHALEEVLLLLDDYAPNLKHCVLQNYARLNNAPVMARDALSKLAATLGPTGTHDHT